jgi:hypothetical protein
MEVKFHIFAALSSLIREDKKKMKMMKKEIRKG